jgi:hypothetical protein
MIKFKKDQWYQIGGDQDPGKYGGIIARYDGRGVDILEICPMIDAVGEEEALEFGSPFAGRDAHYDEDDLLSTTGHFAESLAEAKQSQGLEDDALPEDKIARLFALSEAMLRHWGAHFGNSEERAGYAKDVLGNLKVHWWGSRGKKGYTYLSDEDREFKRLLRERDKEHKQAERRAKATPKSRDEWQGPRRVELHPGTDWWMRGARYGEVISAKNGVAKVRLDKRPGRPIKISVGLLTPVDGSAPTGFGGGYNAALDPNLNRQSASKPKFDVGDRVIHTTDGREMIILTVDAKIPPSGEDHGVFYMGKPVQRLAGEPPDHQIGDYESHLKRVGYLP